MTQRKFSSIWDAIEDSPEQAASMKARAKLMIALSKKVSSWNISQSQAARRLAITQPRLNDLLKGRINKFSLDMLVNLCARAHFRVDIHIKPAA
jgi:predicted XRE-type DNA-binding protein